VGDTFRLEQSGAALRLVPHPNNTGTWLSLHDKSNPVPVTLSTTTRHKRVFTLLVQTSGGGTQTNFLIEKSNGKLLFKDANPDDPRQNGGSASIRR
jgi:hypothetical protein